MIRYALACDEGHPFESWFANSATYDRQVKRGLVSCPVCNSTKVEKAIMAPRVTGTKRRGDASMSAQDRRRRSRRHLRHPRNRRKRMFPHRSP
jgi:hypothetical protein